jgi:peptide/nickel transport system permease protein
MFAYSIRSLAQGALVLVAVAFISFSMFRFVGDPVANMLGQEATLQDRQELSERLGLNDPWPVQFARFMPQGLRPDQGTPARNR